MKHFLCTKYTQETNASRESGGQLEHQSNGQVAEQIGKSVGGEVKAQNNGNRPTQGTETKLACLQRESREFNPINKLERVTRRAETFCSQLVGTTRQPTRTSVLRWRAVSVHNDRVANCSDFLYIALEIEDL